MYLNVADVRNITVGKHSKLDDGVHKLGTVANTVETYANRFIEELENPKKKDV